jgi:NADP-reducing hydrogenase subunit HndB
LAKIRERTKAMTILREGAGRAKVTVHMGTCGIAAGARAIMDELLADIEKRGLQDVVVTTSGCAGLCNQEPMVTVEIQGRPPVKYVRVTPAVMKTIVADHVVGGTIVSSHVLAVGSETMY